MDFVSVCLLLSLIICLYKLCFSRKDDRLPPGPTALPFFGHSFLLRPRKFIAYTSYRKYGPLCTIRLGTRSAVLLNSYRAIQEALLGQPGAFAGRPRSKVSADLCHGIDGTQSQEHRRAILRFLREFGSDRSAGERIVLEECLAMRQRLIDKMETPVDTHSIFAPSATSLMAHLVFGERYGLEDPELNDFSKSLHEASAENFVDTLSTVVPSFAKVRPLLRFLDCFSGRRRRTEQMEDYIRDKISRRQAVLRSMEPLPSELGPATNLCEALIVEQARQEATNPGSHAFTERQLTQDVLDLFLEGTETTAAALTWTMLLLAIHPEVQGRVQREIGAQIGYGRSPAISDKEQLPYVCAVMDEVLRFSSLVPSTVQCSSAADTWIMGYSIPARTTVISNLYGVHHDPELWARPQEFHPEHFLSPDGDYRPSRHLIPFSLGRRECVGAALAKMEVFLALVIFMQSFQVRLADSQADLEAILLGSEGNIRHPLEHKIVFSRL